jgi:RNA polymerase sigma factor (sigma-70 family)
MGLNDLFGSFRKQSPDAQRLLYDMFHKRVYNTAFFVTKDKHLAHDVVQETFLKAFHHMDCITDSEKTGAWLTVIATRTAIDLLRRRKGHIFTPVDPDLIDKELSQGFENREIESYAFKEAVWEKIDLLSPEHRSVIVLKYLEGMTEEEIAENIGISRSAVKSRLHRGKKRGK